MKNDIREILDSILADWHIWAQGYQIVAGHGTSAMFTGVRTSRQYDSEDDLVDLSLNNDKMKTVDFQISEMQPMHRTALCINARNLVTGRSVWTSARLPSDVIKRAQVLSDARSGLMDKLREAGIL